MTTLDLLAEEAHSARSLLATVIENSDWLWTSPHSLEDYRGRRVYLLVSLPEPEFNALLEFGNGLADHEEDADREADDEDTSVDDGFEDDRDNDNALEVVYLGGGRVRVMDDDYEPDYLDAPRVVGCIGAGGVIRYYDEEDRP